MRSLAATIILASAVPGAAISQEPARTPIAASASPVAGADGQVALQAVVVGGQSAPALRAGTEIPVRTRTELTTEHKALRVGQRFEVETSEAISLNGQLVLPVGTTGIGEVTMVRNKGMWGKSGHFGVRLLYLRVGDREIKLTGTIDDKGTAGGVGAVAVSALVFLPAGFFMTGTSARLPAGTIINGFLDEDLPVVFAQGSAPAPLVVNSPIVPAPVVAPAVMVKPTGSVGPAAAQAPARSTEAALKQTAGGSQ
jgi:hypothetical protein